MARLGVGLTYVPGLDRILDAAADLLDVVEIEPQSLWRVRGDGEIAVDEDALGRLADVPGARLLHGVGNPVGGCRLPDPRHTALFGELAERLGTPWVSEHLAFNRVTDEAGGFHTGFMLPPCQTEAGVRSAVRSVRAMAEALPVPLAVEIGTNYLRPRTGELPDGAFVRRVVEGSGCGLLLDLHNVLANERNGRGPVEDLLAALPLDRVWEVHLAGGVEHRGYWLDAHTGLPDDDLLALAGRVLPRLPALRAVLFEVTPSAVPDLDMRAVRDLLVALKETWPRQMVLPPLSSPPPARLLPGTGAETVAPHDWEYALGGLAIGRDPGTPLGRELAADPAVGLLRDLVTEFRGSAITGALRYTMRLLFLTLGPGGVRDLLDAYVRACPPSLFASDEAFTFADHLTRVRPVVPWLADVLQLDLGLLRARLDGSPCTVALGADPTALLTDLGAGRLPVAPRRGRFSVRLVDDEGPVRAGESAARNGAP
ncbi:multinuclear nonheme iron-dependent oxidase [Streptomyces lavendulocolor]|uniref:multinuclear nonheme iron-dependent oxidase n=1 Tax=Streptomyces lavendulocolor TaxID=67316 RepID=UPI0031E3FA59